LIRTLGKLYDSRLRFVSGHAFMRAATIRNSIPRRSGATAAAKAVIVADVSIWLKPYPDTNPWKTLRFPAEIRIRARIHACRYDLKFDSAPIRRNSECVGFNKPQPLSFRAKREICFRAKDHPTTNLAVGYKLRRRNP